MRRLKCEGVLSPYFLVFFIVNSISFGPFLVLIFSFLFKFIYHCKNLIFCENVLIWSFYIDFLLMSLKVNSDSFDFCCMFDS